MCPENTCKIHAGRLLEINVGAGYRSVDDVDAMMKMIGDTIRELPVTTQVVIVADWRNCRVFSPEVAERASKMLSAPGPRVERSAILHHKDQATSVMQVLRLVREAEHSGRRLFTDTEAMCGWLGAILSTGERASLRAFLARVD